MTSRRSIALLVALFWTLFGLVSGFQVWISMIMHGHSVPRLLTYHVLVWEGWLGASLLIIRLSRRFPIVPPHRRNVLLHILAATLIGLAHSFYWIGLLLLMKPFDRMTAEAAHVPVASILFYRLPAEWTLYCLVLGSSLAFDYYTRYRERALEAAQLRASLSDARLHALELQIQPHFLFNTLNAISALVRTERNDAAVEMMTRLSEILRYTLDRAGQQRVALEEELTMLRRYLEIQHARFSDRMSFHFDVAPDATRAAVPTLLLQPLAENAVRHGIAMSASAGTIEIRARRENDRLRIDMFNSGTLDAVPQHGIGLRNTIARLEHLYGNEARFELARSEDGVVASLSIPWSEVA